MKTVEIESYYDGWSITVRSDDGTDSWDWSHEDVEYGAGGEKLFKEVLKCFCKDVTLEELF